ncbi:MAG: phosphonate C-P lyase system protein PhnG [Candidatus Puniceispirillum sp.]|jgi:alpha-D-ribose 1-methylphosphonate 5-triphosphate synthase subunit PhnG
MLERSEWLSVLAKAPQQLFEDLWRSSDLDPSYDIIRPAEIGGIMVRGRMGGTGDPFNLGEMTVSRASVKLSCGTVGHGYAKGRAKTIALRIALCDALLQTADANKVDAKILQPLIEAKLTSDKEIADKAAATKVDFFTLVRGE